MRWLKKWIAVAVLSMSTALAGMGASYGQDKIVRIGFQKYGKLVLLKSQGSLEQKLKPLGYKVSWTEFPSGPPLLEALNVGAIDFGVAGETPPIFAQAAGAPLVYLAYDPPAPQGEAILVPKDSTTQIRRRSQRQKGCAEQGFERSLSSGEGTGESWPEIRRYSAGVSGAVGCAGRVFTGARSMPG